MTITKTCNTCEHYPNDKHCIGCEWDKSKGENSKWELKKNPIVIERKVLEQIRAEIEKCLEAINHIKAMPIQLYTPNEIEARKLTYEQCLGFIDKYKGE